MFRFAKVKKRRHKRRLICEMLENRRLMDADNSFGEAIPLGSLTSAASLSAAEAVDAITDMDVYSFDVDAGQEVTFGITAAFDARVELWRQLSFSDDYFPGERADANSGTGSVSFTATRSAVHYLVVIGETHVSYDPRIGRTGFASPFQGTGDYSIVVERDEAPPEPEVSLRFNSTRIPDGDTTPSALEGTDFGTIQQGGIAVTREFEVFNSGNAVLEVTDFTVPDGFVIVKPLSTSIDAGRGDTFQMRLDSDVPGSKMGDIQFLTNDTDKSPFNFAVRGDVESTASGSEISLFFGPLDVEIVDGDISPTTVKGTDFGSIRQDESAPVEEFTVRNEGDEGLVLSNVQIPSGFVVTFEGIRVDDTQTILIPPGESRTYLARLDTSSVGTKAGRVQLTTNDSDENPFDFLVRGAVESSSSGPVTIDPTPVVMAEGDSGTTEFVFTVTRTDTTSDPAVTYAVVGSGSFPADNDDFVGAELPSGNVTFRGTDATATISVPVSGDATEEPGEDFVVTLSGNRRRRHAQFRDGNDCR